MITYNTQETVGPDGIIIIPLFESEDMSTQLGALETEISETLTKAVAVKDFVGKKGSAYYAQAGEYRVIAMGLGTEAKFDLRTWKQTIGAGILAVSGKKVTRVTIQVSPQVVQSLGAEVVGQASAIAVEIANYCFDDFLSDDAKATEITEVTFVEVSDNEIFLQGVEAGTKIGAGANFTRQLGNVPPSIMTPALLAEKASELASVHENMSVRVLERKDMKELGMGCLLGVAQGSELAPKFIIMEYMNGGDEDPVVLVGKGITFDSGGLSLKPANFMTDMKFDMLGAGTVLGSMHAAVHMGIKRNIVAIVPSAENMPSGTAFRPDDILTAMNGKTVEIGNTDAEGRLILADALSYVVENYKPKVVIDFATLTGACVVALGTERSAVFSPVASVATELLASADKEGEWIWQLPLGEEYYESMKSKVADISNIGDSRYGGASTAAAFLQFFTLDHESGEPAFDWAHFDLASAYKGKEGRKWQRGGATGDVVQTIISYLRS